MKRQAASQPIREPSAWPDPAVRLAIVAEWLQGHSLCGIAERHGLHWLRVLRVLTLHGWRGSYFRRGSGVSRSYVPTPAELRSGIKEVQRKWTAVDYQNHSAAAGLPLTLRRVWRIRDWQQRIERPA